MSRKADPRPERTKALLFEALIELIQEKRWDKIRVQDVLDRTGVGRSTFYAHFDNKYDLLTGAIPRTVTITTEQGDLDLFPLFDHIREVQPILLPIMSQPLLGEMTETFRQQLAGSWADYLATTDVPKANVQFVSDFFAGAFMAVAFRWMEAIDLRQPTEVWAEYQSYVDAVLTEAQS